MSNEQDWLDYVQKLAPAASALGTIAAVVTSLYLAGRQGRDRRERQAEQITAWFVDYDGEQDRTDRIYTGLRVSNASTQAVYDLIAQTVGIEGSVRKTAVGDTEERNREHGALIGTVPPGLLTTRINAGSHGMHRRFGVEIAFQDAAGQHWIRGATGLLREADKHPVDLFNLSRPVGWGAP